MLRNKRSVCVCVFFVAGWHSDNFDGDGVVAVLRLQLGRCVLNPVPSAHSYWTLYDRTSH